TVEMFANYVRGCAPGNRKSQFIGEPKQVAMFCIYRSEKDLVVRAPRESPHTSIVTSFQIIASPYLRSGTAAFANVQIFHEAADQSPGDAILKESPKSF